MIARPDHRGKSEQYCLHELDGNDGRGGLVGREAFRWSKEVESYGEIFLFNNFLGPIFPFYQT